MSHNGRRVRETERFGFAADKSNGIIDVVTRQEVKEGKWPVIQRNTSEKQFDMQKTTAGRSRKQDHEHIFGECSTVRTTVVMDAGFA